MDVAVDAALGDRPEQPDQDDRGEAGAGREALAVAEPEDQQGHDHGAAADPEEAAEEAGQSADRGQLEQCVERIAASARSSCAILDAVPRETRQGTAAPGPPLLEPLRADPRRTAILTDVDGTLAPIVERPEQAAVPAAARELLAGAERALRPGRLRLRAAGAGGAAPGRGRRHRLRRQPRPRAAAARRGGAATRPLAGRARARRRPSSSPALDAAELAASGLAAARTRARSRHCTGAAPRTSAAPRRAPTRSRSRPDGPNWNRAGAARCSSCGRSAAAARTPRWPRCSPATELDRAVYAGDDRTDLDAFRRLRELREEGELSTAVCVGVLSPEAPPELAEESDLAVDGPDGLAGDARGAGGLADALHRPAARHRPPHRRRGDRAGRDHRDRRQPRRRHDDPHRRRRLVADRAARRPLPRPPARAAEGLRDPLARARTATSLPARVARPGSPSPASGRSR